jgi:hypothetical protein
VTETPEEVQHLRACYQALVSYCDEQLGRVIRFMDENQMWDDTLLIVGTDHGHFVSERGFWAKNYMPVYPELANTPLFIWDPRHPVKGVRRKALVQTIDIPATILDYFNQPRPATMQGRSITPALRSDEKIREGGLFGYFGQMTCMIYGDTVFMRAPKTPDNGPLYQYTWMLHGAQAVDREGDFGFTTFPFSQGMPVPKIPLMNRPINEFQREDLLFDLSQDPGQLRPIQDEALKAKMCQVMAQMMKEADAPEEQFVRLGLI